MPLAAQARGARAPCNLIRADSATALARACGLEHEAVTSEAKHKLHKQLPGSSQTSAPKQPNQRASMDRLLLALSNDGRVAYATQPDAFHVGPVGGEKRPPRRAEDIVISPGVENYY